LKKLVVILIHLLNDWWDLHGIVEWHFRSALLVGKFLTLFRFYVESPLYCRIWSPVPPESMKIL